MGQRRGLLWTILGREIGRRMKGISRVFLGSRKIVFGDK